MKKLLIILIASSILFAETSSQIISNQIKDIEEKKIFEDQKQNEDIKENKVYDMKLIEVNEDAEEENCIQIEKINILNMTVFDEDDFDDEVNSYLNKCNGMQNLNNLKKKISNRYIDKGYVTSRAFIKPQDLSDGIVDIEVLEGKVEKIVEDKLNTSNLYSSYEGKLLNLKDLEVVVQQAERLKSQTLDLQLIPGTKVGYTIVKIVNKNINNPYYGNIGINNFGSEYTGKYQIYNNFNYENLFDINDIASININFTDNIFSKNNKTFGTSLNYSFPYNRFLFTLNYDYSNYKQENFDEFNSSFQSDGNNDSYGLNIDYKLYHSLRDNVNLFLNFKNRKTENLLNNIRLDLQSYTISSLSTGIKYSYKGDSFNYYSKFSFDQGLSGQKDEISEQDIKFTKYVLDLGFNKYFNTSNSLTYNGSLRAQYSQDNLFGTEEISMGGVYSVRGFNDTGLSGNTGAYVRNDLSIRYDIDNVIVSPYIGLDYGYVSESKINIFGNIAGAAVGTNIYYKDLNFEIFYHIPLKDAEYTEDSSSNFLGFNFTYNY